MEGTVSTDPCQREKQVIYNEATIRVNSRYLLTKEREEMDDILASTTDASSSQSEQFPVWKWVFCPNQLVVVSNASFNQLTESVIINNL